MYDIILSFLTAFTVTFFAIPSIINIAEKKNLCDEPGERRSHTITTPSLGGIGIFAGTIFSIIMWTPFNHFGDLQYILCAFIIIFLIGAKDDILPMKPWKKIFGQLLAIGILVFVSNIRLTSLYGIFGIETLPYIVSIALSSFTMLVVINAFNLIDGINGLAGSVSTVVMVTLGVWFFLTDHMALAMIAFSTTGAVIAFLKYNITPAKIFMGDTGSLLLGLINAILIIEFIELNAQIPAHPYALDSVPVVAIGIMILPLFDTLRVFTIRILRGNSPFHPDRRHLHHMCIDLGLSHMQATGVLVTINLLFILMVFQLQHIGSLLLLMLVFGVAVVMTYFLHMSVVNRKKGQLHGPLSKSLS